jgi:hypothetical protein
MSRRAISGAGVILIATFAPLQVTAEAAGRSTTAVVNTILNGKGAPKSSLGNNGDFYIDTRSLLIYGPKVKGRWPAPQSIQGPTGPSGSDGRNGSDGKTISPTNVNSVVGPQGIQGATGPVGPQGERGEQGLPGVAGAAGLPGAPGVAGASGSNGAQGPAGPAGATGPKGETGTSGSSEVAVIDIPSWTLSTSTPFSYSSSPSFGSLLANTSYTFQIQVKGSSVFMSMVLGLEVLSAGNTVTFTYSRNNTRYVGSSSISTFYTFDVIGTIQVGDHDGSVQVRILDGFGDSSTNPLTLTGKAYITPVGVIK